MNLSLDFPEFSRDLAVARKPCLEAVVAGFQSMHREPESPIRAVHHQPGAAAHGT
jgi:hypothetical protein